MASGMVDAGRELVERVKASRVFRRSARQRELLDFLADRALSNPLREAHEQEIGISVFGRQADYDTSQDNIVRVHVSELRKKLEQYFETEGKDEAHVLEVPRGAYALVVRPRAGVPAVPAEPPAAPKVRKTRAAVRVLALACALLGALCGYLAWRNHELGRAVAAAPPVQTNPLWRQFFAGNRDTDLIVADSCISLFTDMVNAPVSLQDYINRNYLLGTIGAERDAGKRRELQLLMSRRYTSMADVLTVQRISYQGALDQKNVSIYFARDYPSQRLRSMNVILLGSKRSNPWVEAFEQKMNFRMEYDQTSGDNRVRNLHPRPGETASYVVPGGTHDPRESLAVIAYLPNAGGTGSAVILEGTGLPSTMAAGEAFVSNGFQKIAQALPMPAGSRVPYFEALLRTDAVGASVVSFSVLATRPINPANH